VFLPKTRADRLVWTAVEARMVRRRPSPGQERRDTPRTTRRHRDRRGRSGRCRAWTGAVGCAIWLGSACARPAPSPPAATPPPLALATGNAWVRDGLAALSRARQLAPDAGRAKNVILFIGDGMGISTVTAARIFAGQASGGSGEEHQLAFDTLPYVALLKTYNTNQQVPDSAGTMTAMVTGVKTQSRVLGVDESVVLGDYRSVQAARVRTLYEEAEARGLATGVVSTTRITHATPAACYGHSANRDWESDAELPAEARAAGFPDLARQLVEFAAGDGLEVAMGGGRSAFQPQAHRDPEYADRYGSRLDGRDLIAEWQARPGSAYVWNRDQLEALGSADPVRVLGLFEPSHLRFEADRAADPAGEPSLSQMTGAAIDLLARNPRGFVLMVEGGRIDHAHHLTNAYRALSDAREFSEAVRVARAKTRPADTLIVVTADHGHVFTLAGYPTRGNPILGYVVRNDATGNPAPGPALDLRGRPYTALGYANGPGHFRASPAAGTRGASIRRDLEYGDPEATGGEGNPQHPDYRQTTAVPLAVETHSGEDVPLYAGGPGAALFHGVQEQSYVFYAIAAALGWLEP